MKNTTYKPTKKVITIETTETTYFVHCFLMPKSAKRPKSVYGYYDFDPKFVEFTPKFVEFCNATKTSSSSSIYEASKYSNKIYSVNLEGKMNWNKYIEMLRNEQPEVEILEVWVNEYKTKPVVIFNKELISVYQEKTN